MRSRVSRLPAANGDLSDAPEQMARVLDRPPSLARWNFRCGTRLTLRWRHGAFHDHLQGMAQHLIAIYHSAGQAIHGRIQDVSRAGRSRPGAITLIPAGHDGDWDIEGPIDVSHVYLTDHRLHSCAESLGHARRPELLDRVAVDDPKAALLLQLLSEEASHEHFSCDTSSLFVEQTLDLLCMQLLRSHCAIDVHKPATPRRGLANWQVKRVTHHIHEHFHRSIRLDELAALVSLSRFHFCTAFRLATGQTPHEWLTATRIKHARSLLAESTLPIIDIALAVGYETSSAFAAGFRRAVGTSPSEFRRKHGTSAAQRCDA